MKYSYEIFEKTLPARGSENTDFPESLLDEIKLFLTSRGITSLYCHQAEMFELAQQKKNVVITTSTASGKTLSFLLPVLQTILHDPQARALFIYPTKALASDQLRAIKPIIDYFGQDRVFAGVYDGDTPVNERRRIRNSANIILTNPEMISTAFMPNHSNGSFSFLFSNLRYVVIDELHTYRGAFGSHLANVFRRLSRLCKYYSASPQFFCSSATIANPTELAEKICGKQFVLVSKDGSPSSQRTVHFIQPPELRGTGVRKPVTAIATKLIPELVLQNRSFITFCKSRKAVEIVLKESQDNLRSCDDHKRDFSDLISGYRGGYQPEERKRIERRMISGEIKGLIATNALELGIDIGKVDTAILAGYPGTRASFWQQSGRAGRTKRDCDTFLILDDCPFDQFIAVDPDWLFESGSESATVDINNLFIQLAHVRAAAAELPITLDDLTLFPDLAEILPVLIKNKELRSQSGKYVWCGREFPAGDFSLRNIDKVRYQVINSADGSTIAELDELQAFRETPTGAIYMHEGQAFQVEMLDLKNHVAKVVPTESDYYTDPFLSTHVSVIHEHKRETLGRTVVHFGDVQVTTTIGGFKKIQFHNHQNLGYQELAEPLSKGYESEGTWISIPENVTRVFNSLSPRKIDVADCGFWKSYAGGMGFALLNAAMMTTMTSSDDISCSFIEDADGGNGGIGVCLFDQYIGGLGYSEKAFSLISGIVQNAVKMVSGCRCKDGCAACVGDHHLDKRIILWGLENLYRESPDPVTKKRMVEPVLPVYDRPFSFTTIEKEWPRFIAYVAQHGESLSAFLSRIESVRISGNTLILVVENSFVKQWAEEEENYQKLKNLFTHYLETPYGFSVIFEAHGATDFDKEGKLFKRYDDLTGSGEE